MATIAKKALATVGSIVAQAAIGFVVERALPAIGKKIERAKIAIIRKVAEEAIIAEKWQHRVVSLPSS
jgi:uncharacterized protein (UPF0218 family)